MAKKQNTPNLGTGTTNQGTMSMVPTPATLATHPQTDSQPVPGTGLEVKPKRQRKQVTVTVSRPTPEQVQELLGSPAPAKAAKAPRAPKAPKGPSHADVVLLLQSSGLTMTAKSSDHWHGENPKGPRLVLPKSDTVTRVFLYQVERPDVMGYKTPDQRKAEGLGKVSHVADVTDLLQVKALVTAVCEANGIQLKQDGTPRAKRARKSTPAQGTAEQPNAEAK